MHGSTTRKTVVEDESTTKKVGNIDRTASSCSIGLQNISGRDYPLGHSNSMKTLNMMVHFPL